MAFSNAKLAKDFKTRRSVCCQELRTTKVPACNSNQSKQQK